MTTPKARTLPRILDIEFTQNRLIPQDPTSSDDFFLTDLAYGMKTLIHAAPVTLREIKPGNVIP